MINYISPISLRWPSKRKVECAAQLKTEKPSPKEEAGFFSFNPRFLGAKSKDEVVQ